MFPPPTTIANSAPAETASTTWLAVASRLSGSIPYPPSPAKLSPESLRTTRFTGPKADSGSTGAALSPPAGAGSSTLSSQLVLELVADEAADDNVLADPLNR